MLLSLGGTHSFMQQTLQAQEAGAVEAGAAAAAAGTGFGRTGCQGRQSRGGTSPNHDCTPLQLRLLRLECAAVGTLWMSPLSMLYPAAPGAARSAPLPALYDELQQRRRSAAAAPATCGRLAPRWLGSVLGLGPLGWLEGALGLAGAGSRQAEPEPYQAPEGGGGGGGGHSGAAASRRAGTVTGS